MSASLPPLNITAFPDLKHKQATSEATLGLLSNTTPIVPIGIETCLIIKLLGLFHLFITLSTGSFNLITFFDFTSNFFSRIFEFFSMLYTFLIYSFSPQSK